jgi:UDPglucose 6-dehydrogenase
MNYFMAKKNKTIVVAGLWHLGCVYATGFAKMGYSVSGFDFDKKRITNLKKGVAPIFEPGLEELLQKHSKSLTFSSSSEILKNKDYIFIAHDVMVDENDISDLLAVEKIFDAVIPHISAKTGVVISSQIPVGTTRILVEKCKKNGIENPRIMYSPENLRLGTAYESFLSPDRIILGSDNQEAMKQFEKDFNFSCPIITMGIESAEMVKHALNCYLATCVSFSSELSDIAERVGANMNDVVKALKSDRRVSPFAPLNPGFGFAGATLGRDVQSIRGAGKRLGYKPELMTAVYSVNQNRLPLLLEKIKIIYPSLKNKKIGILGLTYKPNTNTLRRSMSLGLAELLHKKGVYVRAYDPVIAKTIKEYPYIEIVKSLDDFAKDLDMIILMTDWKQFLEVDVEKISKLVASKVVIDTKNFLKSEVYEREGFMYKGIGI